MERAFEATVSSLCYSIISERWPVSGPGDAPPNDVVRFVLAQQNRMPDYLRLPMRVATLTFDTWGILCCGRRFHRSQPAVRLRQVRAWRGSRLRVCRDLIRFYESLAVLAWQSLRYAHQSPQAVRSTGPARALAG